MANDNSIVKFGNLKAGISALWTAIVGKLAGKQDVMQVTALPSNPTDGQVIQWVGVNASIEGVTFITGRFYKSTVDDTATPPVVSWAEIQVQRVQSSLSPSNNAVSVNAVLAVLEELQNKIQMVSMPDASPTYRGKLVQYTGATNATYTHGHFYECVSDGAATPTYSWQRVDVQPAGTDVQGNPTVPSGTTPAALTVLKVGSNYYSVGGGSSTHIYRHTVAFSNPAFSVTWIDNNPSNSQVLANVISMLAGAFSGECFPVAYYEQAAIQDGYVPSAAKANMVGGTIDFNDVQTDCSSFDYQEQPTVDTHDVVQLL